MPKTTTKKKPKASAPKITDTLTYNIFRIGFALTAMVAALIALAFSLTNYPGVEAQESAGSLSGYAWSDNIGWISWEGGDYGITVSPSGVLSGYAWSDNIGWISANSSDLAGCPSSPCSAYFNDDGELQGWLRAIAGGTAQSGGWDGFISLAGSGYGPERQSDGSFAGYAWGSDVVGWLSFNYASTDYAMLPTAELLVRKVGDEEWQESLTIEPTDQIEIGWNQSGAANTATCSSVPPPRGFSTGGAVSGVDSDVEEPVGNTGPTDYRLVCYGSSEDQWSIDTVTVTTTGGEGAEFTPCPGQTSLPDLVRRGTDVEICWEVGSNNPNMCSLKVGGMEVVPSSDGVVSYTHNVIGEVEFKLECLGGNSATWKVQSVIEVQET